MDGRLRRARDGAARALVAGAASRRRTRAASRGRRRGAVRRRCAPWPGPRLPLHRRDRPHAAPRQAGALALVAAGVAVARLRTRRTRAALARLVLDIGTAPAPGELRERLADSLGDPSLQLLYRL